MAKTSNKKLQAAAKASGALSLGQGELDIPDVLKRDKGNVSPAMRKGEPRISAAKTVQQTRSSFDRPMGMTDEEYERLRAEFEPTTEAKPVSAAKAERREAKAQKKAKRVPRGEAPAGTFKLAEWAKSVQLEPRHVRSVARSIKSELSRLYEAGMKYVFKDEHREKVAKLIHEGLANETKKTVKVKKKAAEPPTIPPPSETVWSGKSGEQKPGPKAVDNKGDLRKEAKAAVKSFGKRNISKAKKK